MTESIALTPVLLKPQSSEKRSLDSRRLYAIEVLRGLAAIWVLLFHARGFFLRTEEIAQQNVYNLSSSWNPIRIGDYIVSQGWIGVSLFFIVSGFCVHLPFASKKPFDLRQYLYRRLFRLWPPYAVAIVLGLAMGIVAKWDTLANLLVTAFLHFGFWIWGLAPLSTSDRSLNPVFWSIVVEVQLYLLYALHQPWLTQRRIYQTTVYFLVLGLIYCWVTEWILDPKSLPNILQPRYFALARFGEWLIGACIADVYISKPLLLKQFFDIRALVIGFAVVLFVCIASPIQSFRWFGAEQQISIGFALIALYCIASEKFSIALRTSHGLTSRAVLHGITWISERSYSLYLFHFPCLAIAGEFSVRARLLGDTTKNELGGTFPWFLVSVSGVVLAFTVTEIVYRLVEKPCHQYARRAFS